MSNYIVKPESIAKIANLIKYANFNRWSLVMPESIHNAFYFCKDNDGFFDPAALCRALAQLNILAVDSRYNRNTDPDEIEAFYNECISLLDDNYTSCPEWVKGRRVIKPEHIQLYKTLQCYIYQIDSDTTYQGDCYNALCELSRLMAAWIVSNTEEYINANWE